MYYFLRWTEGLSKGWVDAIPSDWFTEELSNVRKQHFVVGPNNSSVEAHCVLSVEKTEALLEYSAEMNPGDDIDRGEMKIIFADEDRSQIDQIKWNNRAAPVIVERLIEEGAIEGNPTLISHMIRERDSSLRRQKIEDALKRFGHLECEGCKVVHESMHVDTRAARGMYDVHHKRPIAEGERVTDPSALAVLCACCHRLIHRLTPMKTVEDFAAYYLDQSSKVPRP